MEIKDIKNSSGIGRTAELSEIHADADEVWIYEDAASVGSEGITFKSKTITVRDPFTGTVSAADFDEKVNLINATAATNPVVLIAGDKASALRAGTGGSTLIGGKGNDKLYGNAITAEDVFVYELGQGSDIIYNYEAQDAVSIGGVSSRDEITLKDSKSVVTITFDGDTKSKLTVNKNVSTDELTLALGTDTFVYGSLPADVYYNNDSTKTALIVDATASGGVEINAADITSSAKTIDGSASSGSDTLIGNDVGNVIKAGSGGVILYGGHSSKGVADKLYGGSGADTFQYQYGDGSDIIYDFDGKDDVVQILGQAVIRDSSFKVSGSKVILTVEGKSKLTFDNPKNKITILDESGSNTLYTYGEDMPDGMTYNTARTVLTIDTDAALSSGGDVDLADFASTVKEVNATAFGNPLNIIGNKNANILRAPEITVASGATLDGSTLDGGLGADKLYGSAGADVFLYSLGGGKDIITNYNYDEGDIISVTGGASITGSSFKDSGKNVVLTVTDGSGTTGTITINNAKDKQILVDNDGDTIGYGVIPEGVTYNTKKTAITIDDDYTETSLDASNFTASLVTIDASANTSAAIELIGNAKANVIKAGEGGATLDGGKGNDKLYGGDGADIFILDVLGGKDVVYDFDAANDVIQLRGANSLTINDITEKGDDVILKVSSSTLTLKDVKKDADSGTTINITDDSGMAVSLSPYTPLPSGMTYSNDKTQLIMKGTFMDTVDVATYAATNDKLRDVNASAATGSIYLIGDAKNNILRAGSGGSTLEGGAGNDTLYGSKGSGADVFLLTVGGGSDVVVDYKPTQGDVILASGALTNGSVSGKAVVLSVGSDSFKMQNMVNKNLTVELPDGTREIYKFTSKNNTLEKALVNNQLPATADDAWGSDENDFWFERDAGETFASEIDEITNGLGELAQGNEIGKLAFDGDPMEMFNKGSLASVSTRDVHHKK